MQQTRRQLKFGGVNTVIELLYPYVFFHPHTSIKRYFICESVTALFVFAMLLISGFICGQFLGKHIFNQFPKMTTDTERSRAQESLMTVTRTTINKCKGKTPNEYM